MKPLYLSFIAAMLCVLSGTPALLPFVAVSVARRVAFAMVTAAMLCGLSAVCGVLLWQSPVEVLTTVWQSPLGSLVFRLDALSAFFMIPVLLVGNCVSLYSCGYYSTSPKNRAESSVPFFFGIILAAVIMLLLSGSGVTMLFFWEIMALAVFIAMCLEHQRQEVLDAGIQYLVASHVTILVLIMMFGLLFKGGRRYFPSLER